MTRKESMKIAREIRDSVTNFNDVNDEVGFDLYTFEMDGATFNVFAYVRKEQDEHYRRHKWYAVYAGVEYDGGDDIYADYDNSTNSLRVSELADVLFKLSKMYEDEKHLNELRNMIAKKTQSNRQNGGKKNE